MRFRIILAALTVATAAGPTAAQTDVFVPASDPLKAWRPDPNPIAEALRRPAGRQGVTCWWLGNSAFAVQMGEKVILTDPVISTASDDTPLRSEMGWRPDGPGEWLRPAWECDRHVALRRRIPLLAREAPRADLVVVSHAHEDHAGSKSLRTLTRRTEAIFCGPAEVGRKLRSLGIPAARIVTGRPGDRKTVAGVDVQWTYAAHGGESACCGFLLRHGGSSVFYPGDTNTTERIDSLEDVDVLLLPIPEQYLGGERGAKLADALDAGCVIPCHYRTYDIPGEPGEVGWLGGDPREVARRMKRPERLVDVFQGQGVRYLDGKSTVIRTPNPRLLHEQAWPAPEEVTLDGKLDEWARARWTIRLTPRAATPWGDDAARVAVMWDQQHLYIAFDVRDRDVQSKHTGEDVSVWEDDCIEIDVDPKLEQTPVFSKTCRIYHVTPAGATQDAAGSESGAKVESWDSAAKWGVAVRGTLNDASDTDEGYVVEMAIPFKEWDVTPAAGKRVAIDFVVLDTDAEGRGYYYDWADIAHVQTPSDWGVVELAAPAEPPVKREE